MKKQRYAHSVASEKHNNKRPLPSGYHAAFQVVFVAKTKQRYGLSVASERLKNKRPLPSGKCNACSLLQHLQLCSFVYFLTFFVVLLKPFFLRR